MPGTAKNASHQQRGPGGVFTSNQTTIDASSKIAVTRAKEAGKEKKRVERERRKELRAEIEQEWAEMKHQHNAAVENWTSECSKLQETGLRKKDLPPKPKLGKKPKLPVVEDEDEDEEDEPNEKGDV
ncbi:hypothetical protein R3P38DRAFT_3351342 [Favolaschia claudopus]|uniref:Uncharacterized protein n=1 Tax=Favolaschia claudopus TaxID=2862362 RepID=A0AAW0CAF6_9AGAR